MGRMFRDCLEIESDLALHLRDLLLLLNDEVGAQKRCVRGQL
jgi:hypothetical protein